MMESGDTFPINEASELSHHVQKENEVFVQEDKVQDGNESDESESNLVATQGIFAHSTSLEDSITDDLRNLDLLTTQSRERKGSMLADSVMKSSIHELQGDDAVIQIKTEDLIQPTTDEAKSSER